MIYEELEASVAKAMEKYGVPGAAVGIVQAGRTSTSGFGVTNVAHPVSVNTKTLFQVGSITKTFTATAIMRLVAEGKLDLDVPIQTYVPGFRVRDKRASAGATLRHLLTHRGGWTGDFYPDTGTGDNALAAFVEKMADLEQLAPLGLHYSYNNAGFSLAGHVLATAKGSLYEEALDELVLAPLGFDRVFFRPGDVITHRFVVGHRVEEGTPVVAEPWPLSRAGYPSGGVVCDIETLLEYAQFHLGDGTTRDSTRLLPQEHLEEMQSPQAPVVGNTAIGLSWLLQDVDGLRVVLKRGGTTGQISTLMLIPEHGFAFAMVTNADSARRLVDEMECWVLEKVFGVKRPTPQPIEAAPEDLRPFAGHYVRPFAQLHLGLLAGKLVAQFEHRRDHPEQDWTPPPDPPPASLALCEGDSLLVVDGPLHGNTIDVIRDADGSISWLRWGRLQLFKRT